MRKKLLSAILAGALSVSVIAGSAISASATRNPDDTYSPSAGVDTFTYKFAMPGVWKSEVTEKKNNACGIYWWNGSDLPKDAFSHEWPGYKMVKDPDVVNLHYTKVPTNSPMVIFNNFIDGGMDTTAPEFTAACQGPDKNVEYFSWGDSDYYTDDFWRYVYTVAMEDLGLEDLDPEDDQAEIDEEAANYPEDLKFEVFGDYASNFYYNEEAKCIVYNPNNMVFLIDLRPERMSVSYEIVPEGKVAYGGEFFFSYGGGLYGIWPTLELAIEQEGLPVDEEGNVVTDGLEVIAYDKDGNPDADAINALEGLALDKYGNIVKRDTYYDFRSGKDMQKLVYVYGDFTGKYWEDTEAIPLPSVPAPSGQDATSSTKAPATSDTPANNGNGAIATGEFSFAAIAFVVVVAGLGVFYFTRKKYTK